jgi:hypothetical protein
MKDQVLSVEQMKVLGELGIDIFPDKDSLNWYSPDDLHCGITGYDICRAFTLQDVLELLPRWINSYALSIGINSFYICPFNVSYSYVDVSTSILHQENGKTLLDAAYKMLLWTIKK